MSGQTSGQIRVLALTTRKRVTAAWVDDVRNRLGLDDQLRLELLSVFPPAGRVRAERIDVVDLSRVPWRPVVPVAGDGLATWGGARKTTARALRASRKALLRARRGRIDLEAPRALEIACATSRELARRAAGADVVVALDGPAVRSVAALGRRTPSPLLVFGPRRVRPALEAAGRVLPGVAGEEAAEQSGRASTALPEVPDAEARVLIAPANYAGQAHAWAEAVRRHVDGATALNVQVGAHPHFPFECHHEVDRETFAGSLDWRLAMRSWVEREFTHVIVEANRAVLGHATNGENHTRELRRAGKRVALLSHGSDARIPSVHMANEKWHAYDEAPPATLEALERVSRINCDFYNSYDGTVFVSTPGLRAFVPAAVWLPLVVDVDLWHRDDEPMEREVPIVAHIPSSWQKGSNKIDPVLESLQERGLIEYRRLQNLSRAEMPEAYGTADIVVEQFGIADYSTAAVEAMSGGRVVVSRVADEVRAHVREQTGLELPIVEANPETLEQVILDLVADRARAKAVAREGRAFAREVHDGRRSGRILGEWIAGD
jgi:hypothetical protein